MLQINSFKNFRRGCWLIVAIIKDILDQKLSEVEFSEEICRFLAICNRQQLINSWEISKKVEWNFVEMSIGASDVIAILNCLGKVTWEQARYSLCFDSLVEELDQEKNKLQANIEDLNENVQETEENTIRVGKRIELELRESKDVIKEVHELVKKVKPKKTCCQGPCPDLIWQYRLGRQVANKTNAMKQLNAQFQPQKFSRIQSLPGMGYYSSEDFIPFKSTKKASDELSKALKDPKIRRIGLYGMGGCGKTTLVKEVGNEAEKLFKKVIFVAVSSTLEVRKIQGSIADALKLTLKEENEPERAKRLYMRLSISEKILIILDDVWEELDFEAIGIPFDDTHKGCRILLTTRLRGVCVSLKCHKMVRLDLLSEKEAWQLFKRHAGINEDASEKSLKGLPRVISKACKGLPVAIAAIASALKDKTLEEWKEACDLLKRYELVDIAKNSKDPYASLRLSYDHLKKKEAQDLFLLCSLFPEDSEIKEEDLIRMGIGLGLFENVYSCGSARIRGRATIRKLLDSFLLLQTKEGISVMLHDILRAVALNIADKKIQTILEPTVRPSLMELLERVATEEITKLYCHNIHEFPLQFKCPKLEILIVCKDGKGSPEVPDEFFNEMARLKVLTIIDKSSWQNSTLMLPTSMWSLKCLRTLCIRGCRLDFIFSLQHLQHLEILEFCDCSIIQLPNDIVKLKKLNMLDVSRCRVRGNPYKVLGNCPGLEELYFSEIDLDEEELKDQNLAELFGKNDYLIKLERYNVQIGACVDKLKDDLKSRFLSVSPYSDKDTSISTTVIKDLAQRAEVLFLENIPKSCENVIPDIVYQEGGCLNDLIELLLRDSVGIRCLIDTTNQLNQIGTVFSKLHKLRITGMKYMEDFCRGEPPCVLFEQLKELECSQLPVLSSLGKPYLCNLVILKLESCPKLEYLFTPAVAVSLVLLEELKITKCHGLIYIIGDDTEEDIIDDNDQKAYGSVFTKLKELVVGDCSKLEYLIPLSFAWGLENLEILKIYLAPNLKYALGEYNHTHQSCNQNQNLTQIINLPVLKVLELLNLEEIISIFPENFNAKFPDVLESHIVDNCPNLDTIISTNVLKVYSDIKVQENDEPLRKAKLFFMPSGTSIIAENIKQWVCAPIRQAGYSLRFKRYVDELRTEKETLKFTRQSLEVRVERETLEIDRDVKGWLDNAGTLIDEAEKLEQEAIANRSCCLGRVPNWIQRYRMGKQAARKINAIIKHNQSREFQKFSQHASLPRMEDYFQEDFIFFDSRKIAYYSLLESFKEDEISIVGLYGERGVGKTTLAKQVGKEAEHLFDRVIFVVVPSKPEVRKIQEKIARSLDWKLKEEDELERARWLFTRLSSAERILLILDDVCDGLNLEVIGIPFGVNRKGCSVLIITQFKQVCIMMDCRRMFPLSLLTAEEAWALFGKHAQITEDTNNSLNEEAKRVTQECGGLPLAIAAVASTLRGKTEVEWKKALKKLQSSMDMEVGWGNIRKCLQFSYDNLADEIAKSLFLLCSLFPKDFEIHEEYLMRYGIVLSLFGEVSSYERARNQLSVAKEKLIDSCLLLKVNEGQCVKMHDLFHELALSIAVANEEEIVVLEKIHEWPLRRNTTTLRYLWCENADKFPNGLDFPKLDFLYLGVSEVLPDKLFKGMKNLRVLVLRCKSYHQDKPNLTLTKSILSLPNLLSLFLEGWRLGDISFVGSLKRLEALVLWNCSFQELPVEITELRNLRLLDLSECVIKRNAFEAIGRCSQLQELYYLGNSYLEWEYQGHDGVAFFQENEISLKLERYCIEIGDTYRVFRKGDFSTSRGLSIEYFDASTSNETVKNLVQRAEVLSLEQIYEGCENVIPDMIQQIGEGINELIELQLCDSGEIKCITDATAHVGAFFPRLTKLRIKSLWHMEALFCGPILAGSFQKLKNLELCDCPWLKSLFTVSVAQSLEMLEVMIITRCDSLKHIIWDAAADTEAEEVIIIIDDDQKSISAFPKLELLIVQDCEDLEYLGGHWLFNLCSLKKLMEVFGVPHGEDSQAIMLPTLKMLKFIDLPDLVEVSLGFKLHHATNTVVKDCPKFLGSVDGFQIFPQVQNPEKEFRELNSESEDEEVRELDSESEEQTGDDIIWQSIARSQEKSEVHNAQAGTSSIINTASSSGEVDIVHGSSTNISMEDKDDLQASLDHDVSPLAATNQDVTSSGLIAAPDKEYQTPVIKASSSSEVIQVQSSSSNIIKGDRHTTPQTSLTQDANMNEDQRSRSKKEGGSIFNLPMYHGDNFENGDGHSGNAIEGPTLQTIKEPVQDKATLKSDQNDHGINFRKGKDSQRQEFDTSNNAENAAKEASKESVHGLVPVSEKYSATTSLPGGNDFDSQTATNQVVNLNDPLAATNSGYTTPEDGDQMKMEEMNVIEQSETQMAIPLSGKMPTELDLSKATETIMNFPKLQEDSSQGPSKEGKHEYQRENVNTGAGSSGAATLKLPPVPVAQNVDITIPAVIPAPTQGPITPVSLAPVHALPTDQVDPMTSNIGKPLMTLEEEYSSFRDIVAIKKKHIPLLEQAITSYPSLWTWHEKSRHPQMTQFGYIMLGNMLEFLASTKWRDLTEEKKAEFLFLLDGLEAFGFDTQWLANTCARIKGRKTINRMKMLEQQAMTLESELHKTKLELDGIRVELEDFNNFIGF
ncbi:hypothetical protein L6164_024031 [Bauhinia variegata]|uniref:Uncharacterized protein n=1 Tax=Bauhinia variegata TaxID=167791 RepID=A0ACB9LW92_BAUVA|nr:hypothetical protein L6164_024031 [Bauhinia variegata]